MRTKKDLTDAKKNSSKKSTNVTERLRWLHRQIVSGFYPTEKGLAEEFGLTTAAAKKDVDFFAVAYGAPLAVDPKRKGYYYTDPAYTLPSVRLSDGELVAILAAEALKKAYRGSPFSQQIESAFEKIATGLSDIVTVDMDSLDNVLQIEVDAAPPLDMSVFSFLIGATRHHETVMLRYFSGQKAYVTDKITDPYHVVNFKDNWYLVAYCHEKQEFRDFLCARILSAEKTGRTFVPDPAFSIEKHRRESLLFGGGERPVRVVAEFDKFASHWIRLKSIHPTQEITERSDGSLEISFTVTSYENILRWILSFGEHARILAPFELQDKVRRSVERMGALYKDTGGKFYSPERRQRKRK
jgi:predicted DNA-binding transcriptional regulator YafY